VPSVVWWWRYSAVVYIVSYSAAVLSTTGCSAEVDAKFPEESNPRSSIH